MDILFAIGFEQPDDTDMMRPPGAIHCVTVAGRLQPLVNDGEQLRTA